MSPAEALAKFLIQTGVLYAGTSNVDWSVYISTEPPSPDNVVTLFDYSAITEGRIQKTGESVYKGSVQIRIRSKTHGEGWKKGKEIESTLDLVGVKFENQGYGKVVLFDGPKFYTMHAVHLLVPLARIGQEEKNRRQLFVTNVLVSLSKGVG